MNSFWEYKGILEPSPGSEIGATIKEAILIAGEKRELFTFNFNDVSVTVAWNSNPDLIYRDWCRAMAGSIESKQVGPFPAQTLTPEELVHDAEVEAGNERRREESQRHYQEEARKKGEELSAVLAGSPALEIAVQAFWDEGIANNKDPYGAAIYQYAEMWGRLMQIEMANGKSLPDIADECSHTADTEGITGFMYGCAVSILAGCWKYGEELRRWHNLKTQVGKEGERANETGGVLNPAIMTIGTPE